MGETGRRLETQKEEHKDACRNGRRPLLGTEPAPPNLVRRELGNGKIEPTSGGNYL